MKIAIYNDSLDAGLAACMLRCIGSIRRHMPDVEIVHLTTENGPRFDVDTTIVSPNTTLPFGPRRMHAQAKVEGDVLFIDCDVMLKGDISHVFEDKTFDICVTTDMKPGAPNIKFNGGVVFSRHPKFWLDLGKACEEVGFDWYMLEGRYNELAASGKYAISELDGYRYNRLPENAEDECENALIVHYRGPRKIWMQDRLMEIGKDIKFKKGLNTPLDEMHRNIEANLKRKDVRTLFGGPPHNGTALLVGGGPSLAETLGELRARQAAGAKVFAMNATHDYLMANSIVPDYHVMLDARRENAEFVRAPDKRVRYMIASQCHPDVFDALQGFDVTQWVGWTPDAHEIVKKSGVPVSIVGGGGTVGIKALCLVFGIGYRNIELFGFDSSYREGAHHAYAQPLNDKEARIDITANGRKFLCARWMARQTMDFQEFTNLFHEKGATIRVHGDGLLPWVAQCNGWHATLPQVKEAA